MKKTGLGRDPLSWINSTSAVKSTGDAESPLNAVSASPRKRKKTPKFQTFDVRLTSLLREDQLEFLEKLIREIQKNRAQEYRKERITKNTLIRVFIDAFKDAKIDTENIPDEETLLKRVIESRY